MGYWVSDPQMPPSPGIYAASDGFAPKKRGSNTITLDVGGKLFRTTPQTLIQAGPKSFLASLSNCSQFHLDPPFIDRDPDLFAVLLSLLRTGNLPSRAKGFDVQDLISEAQFYGLESQLLHVLSDPSHFDSFNLEKSVFLPLNGRDSPSAISTTPYGDVHVAHGSKITSFDWSLRRKSTILTQFPAIDSLLSLSSTVAAAGATDYNGLQILDVNEGSVLKTVYCENETASSSTVQAIGSSDKYLFASYESSRRNSNSIVVLDIANSLLPVMEIARQEIYGAEIDSAIPSSRLEWVSSLGLLMASGFHSSPSGRSGNIRFWDIRSGNIAWNLKEREDCFSDATASSYLSAIFKVGINSGNVFMLDFRMLGGDNPWMCLGMERKLTGKKEGAGCKIQSCGSQIFCSRGGDIELWSEIVLGSSRVAENGFNERVFRKNLIGRAKDLGGSKITSLCFGGKKMVLTREDQQQVEVWESSRL